MSKRTDGAGRAAEVIIELACNVGAFANKQKHLPFPSRGTTWSQHRLTAIIDQETGLPEITAARDRLEEALIEIRVKLGFPLGKALSGTFSIDWCGIADIVRLIDAALAKPEGGEKDDDS